MTEVHLSLNNFNDWRLLKEILPISDKYEFTAKKVFRKRYVILCSCGTPMVHNGYDYARKKHFGKVRIGKQICPSCNNKHHEDKSFWKKLLADWQEILTNLILLMRDSHVSWEAVSKILHCIIPCSKTKAMYLFNDVIEQFSYPQDNFLIVNYDEQHPKQGRTQKYRLTLLNYRTKIPIADELFDDKENETIKMFLLKHLDTTKELIIITDCDRRYPRIFKELWGEKVIHQKCLLHLNKLIVKDFGQSHDIIQTYNKYLLLDIFYNRRKELKFLEKFLKKLDKKNFCDAKTKSEWQKEQLQKFYEYVKELENERRRQRKTLPQRPLWRANKNFAKLLYQQKLFPKKIQVRLQMIKKNWKYFTAFYAVENCPATNNALENYYSTSLKTHSKKQLRTDNGLENHIKLAACKKTKSFAQPRKSFLEIFASIKCLVT